MENLSSFDFEKYMAEIESSFVADFVPSIDASAIEISQRTPEWFAQRCGVFTASGIKDLMACDSATAKMEWGRPEKLFGFGKTALKYIYSKARERGTGKVISEYTSKKMQAGTEAESLIIDKFMATYPRFLWRESGFVLANDFKYIGASPDGICIDTETGEILAYEMKLATSFETEFDRVIMPVEQSHIDFWQVQTQMLCLDLNRAIYVVAEPPVDINNEISIDNIQIQFVERSEIHCKAIMDRARLGNMIIEKYLAGANFWAAVSESIKSFE